MSDQKTEKNTIQTLNPATGEILKTYTLLSESEITKKIEKSQTAFQDWKKNEFCRAFRAVSQTFSSFKTKRTRISNPHNAGNGKTNYARQI